MSTPENKPGQENNYPKLRGMDIDTWLRYISEEEDRVLPQISAGTNAPGFKGTRGRIKAKVLHRGGQDADGSGKGEPNIR